MLLQLGRDLLSVWAGLIRPRDNTRHWLTIGGGRARGETLTQAGAQDILEIPISKIVE